MPHGLPDWWGAAPKSTTYGLQDMAELAARLGSIVTFDRRGDVIWQSRFEDGIAQVGVSGTGTYNEVYPQINSGHYAGNCLVLKTGNAAGDLAEITKVLPYPALGGIGHEIGFSLTSGIRYVYNSLIFFTGSQKQWYCVRYVHTSGALQLLHSNGTWYNIGSPGIQREGEAIYNQMKLVGDILNSKYVRVVFNSGNYLASAYAPYVTADTTTKSMTVGIDVYTDIAANVAARAAYMIVTQNEPVT